MRSFKQRVAGSSPARLINICGNLGGSKWPAFFHVHTNVHAKAVVLLCGPAIWLCSTLSINVGNLLPIQQRAVISFHLFFQIIPNLPHCLDNLHFHPAY